MENICGAAVRGENFAFREKEVADVLNQLKAGQSVLLIGLRRIGKTSLMFGIEDAAPSTWTVSYHNVQDMRMPSDFFKVLLSSLPKDGFDRVQGFWQRAKTVPNRVLNTIKTHLTKLGGAGASAEFNAAIVDFWEPLTDGISHVLADTAFPVVLLLDEFPIFIEHMLKANTPPAQVEAMLGQLKAWRDQHPPFRVVVGGSISLDRILAKHDIAASTIGDLSRYFLPPLDRRDAHTFLETLANKYDLARYDDRLIDESLDLIEDYLPYFLQAFFLQIRQHADPNAVDVDEIFENRFIPYIRKPYFDQYLDRLRSHYPPVEQTAARTVFELIASQPERRANYSQIRAAVETSNAGDARDLNEMLYDLTGDDFLRLDSRTNEYSFAIGLTARWWQLTRGRG